MTTKNKGRDRWHGATPTLNSLHANHFTEIDSSQGGLIVKPSLINRCQKRQWRRGER